MSSVVLQLYQFSIASPVHGCLVHFVDIADHVFLCAKEINALTKKLLVNDKITASCPTKVLPKHYIKRYEQQIKMSFEKQFIG